MSVSVEELQDVVDNLEKVQTDRIRAEGKYEQEMEVLKGLGYSSIKKAEKALIEMNKKIEKGTKEVEDEFNDFMQDYKELFD